MHVNTNKIGSPRTCPNIQNLRTKKVFARGAATILLSTFRSGLSNYQIATFNCKPSSHQRLGSVAEPRQRQRRVFYKFRVFKKSFNEVELSFQLNVTVKIIITAVHQSINFTCRFSSKSNSSKLSDDRRDRLAGLATDIDITGDK